MVDSMETTNLQERLLLHRQTLAHYFDQWAMLGSAHAPPSLAHGIREARDEIQQIKLYLRGLGLEISDQQNDFEAIVDTK